jgi:hypothetical protein
MIKSLKRREGGRERERRKGGKDYTIADLLLFEEEQVGSVRI